MVIKKKIASKEKRKKKSCQPQGGGVAEVGFQGWEDLGKGKLSLKRERKVRSHYECRNKGPNKDFKPFYPWVQQLMAYLLEIYDRSRQNKKERKKGRYRRWKHICK